MVLLCVRLSIDMGPPFFFFFFGGGVLLRGRTPMSLLSGDRIFRVSDYSNGNKLCPSSSRHISLLI